MLQRQASLDCYFFCHQVRANSPANLKQTRQIIEKLYRKHVPVAQIADLLDVHRSTIYRELQLGRVTHLNSELISFSTYSADRASDEHKLRASTHGPSLKIANDRALVSQFNELIINHKLSIYAARQVLINKGVDVKVSLRTLYNSLIEKLKEQVWLLLNDAPPVFQKLGKTLRLWFEPIIRMWRFTKSNGITEGFHRKMKLIQRRGFGYRNFQNYRLRVLIECGRILV